MHNDIGRQFLQRLQVVPEGLLDEVALLHAGRADVPFEQLAGRPGHERRDLRFSLHEQSRIFYISVAQRVKHAKGACRLLSRSEMNIHARLERFVLPRKVVVEPRRGGRREERRVLPRRMLILDEDRQGMRSSLPRGRCELRAAADLESPHRCRARGDRPAEVDVEILVQPADGAAPVHEDPTRRDGPHLRARRQRPMSRRAQERAARECVVDRLVEEIERGEGADDQIAVGQREVVADDDAAAERIAGLVELVRDSARQCRFLGEC